ncbi:MAG: hypothetical protein ACRDAI_00640 [Candidatus Rhabdochlamydia sp.]
MPAITNFNLFQSIQSLSKPFKLTIPNKQQIINKTALAALAILVITCGLATAEGTIWDLNKTTSYRECTDTCDLIKSLDSKAGDVLVSCYTFCKDNFLL